MRFLFVVTGLGEAAQATAVALHARAKGIEIKFVSTTQQCHEHIVDFGFDDSLLPAELSSAAAREEIERAIEEYAPDVVFCCNSKTTGKVFFPRRKPDYLVVSLDSNWLFQDMPAFFDRFFVVFPRAIFAANRNYAVDDERVLPVGFVPSGYELGQGEIAATKERLGIGEGEAAIFAYFGRGITFRGFLIDTLLEATAQLQREGQKIRTVLLSDRRVDRADVTSIAWLAHDREFDLYLAASSCLVSHHGMGTLAKAVMATTPFISFVPDGPCSEAFEVEPFRQLGLCLSLTYSAQPEELKAALHQVLFTDKGKQIQKEQRKYAIPGEANVLAEIERLLARGKEPRPRKRALLVYDWFGADLSRLDLASYEKVVICSKQRLAIADVTFIHLAGSLAATANTVSDEINMARSIKAVLCQYYDVDVLVSTYERAFTSDPGEVSHYGLD